MTNAELIRRLRAEAAKRGDCYVCRCRPAKFGRRTCQHCIDLAHAKRDRNHEKWAAAGLCVRCGRERAPGVVVCKRHRDKWKAKNAARYHDARARRMCVRCRRRLATPRKTMCSGCNDAFRAYQNERNAERVANGTCALCGRPVAPTSAWMCPAHLEKQRGYTAAYAERKRSA